jgi:aldehyde:ferredoxin oxidoreductase
MNDSYGWVGKILWVNLCDRSVRTLDTLDYGPQYIGGRGLAARLAWEFIPPGVGAFDPENLLMIFTGPLTGTTAPFSGRTAISGLSPQGWPHPWFSRSNLGGHWGPSLKYAGYDGLVIEGQADHPTTLAIEDSHVAFLDARHLWGKGTMETQKMLLKQLGADLRILTIGQAGENLSRIAIISTETESAAGQGGYGAVMGAKNLKAIAVRGSGPVYVAQPDLFLQRCRAIVEEARTGSLFAGAELDAERVDNYKQRWQACTQQCGMRCGSGCRFYGDVTGPVSGERLAGQFHCVSNFFPGIPNSFYNWKLPFEGAFEARHMSDDFGLNQWDLLLGLVPWLRLCQADGLIGEFNGRAIDFDDPAFWAHFMRAIAYREGLGDALAEGGRRAPEILGFGQELAKPLYAAWGNAGHWDGHGDRGNRIVYPFWLVPALQWMVDVRDPYSSSHGYTTLTMHWSPFLDKSGFSWDTIKAVGARVYGTAKAVDPQSDYEGKERAAVWHGHRSVMKDSVPVDDVIFPMIMSRNSRDGLARAGDMFGPDFEYHLFTAATGLEMTRDAFELACERIFNLERAFQVRNYGRQRADDETVIPYFEYVEWWENPLIGEKKRLERDKFVPVLENYYRMRGWDLIQGWPTPSKLHQLGLDDVATTLYDQESSTKTPGQSGAPVPTIEQQQDQNGGSHV